MGIKFSKKSTSMEKSSITIIFPFPKGDPVCSLYINETGSIAGTILGRVFLHIFEKKRSLCLAAWTDDAVRGVYMDSSTAWATVGESHASSWSLSNPKAYRQVRFEKPLTDSTKFVLQDGPLVVIVCKNVLWKVDVVTEVTECFQFQPLEDGTVTAPTDFNGTHIAIAEWPKSRARRVHVHATTTQCPVESVINLPKSSPSVTQIKLWPPGRLVTVFKQRCLHVWNLQDCSRIHEWSHHTDDIIAIDGSKMRLVSLAKDGIICIWDTVGGCIASLYVPGATFSLGFPYYIMSNSNGSKIIFSSDEGVLLVERS
eukprot:GHVL01003748.1.p1 GENE.GHVL01003748.1~~GHVL01003748.1.p1  ORF type:complete len:313 (+),score=45.72 GHVL01003748.1:47-985(+)